MFDCSQEIIKKFFLQSISHKCASTIPFLIIHDRLICLFVYSHQLKKPNDRWRKKKNNDTNIRVLHESIIDLSKLFLSFSYIDIKFK